VATIGDQLQTYRLASTEAQAKGESAVAGTIEQQIRELEEFLQRHPEEAEAPSPSELGNGFDLVREAHHLTLCANSLPAVPTVPDWGLPFLTRCSRLTVLPARERFSWL